MIKACDHYFRLNNGYKMHLNGEEPYWGKSMRVLNNLEVILSEHGHIMKACQDSGYRDDTVYSVDLMTEEERRKLNSKPNNKPHHMDKNGSY
jgi:hypothetical protein